MNPGSSTDNPLYKIYTYTEANLQLCLCDDEPSWVLYDPKTGKKLNFLFLCSYLQEIKAAYIVHELTYVDEDFLQDHSAYYAKCYESYPRHCQRLHFFRDGFTKENFEELLTEDFPGSKSQKNSKSKEKVKVLNDVYIGFIVIRQIATCRIGRTCLATYNEETQSGGKRYYSTAHIYHANLFGIPLTVKTLAFQEQDHGVAACATSALWSALNATGRYFHHTIPSPVEITETANEVHSFSRKFPSEGLNSWQMLHVLHKYGIQPVVCNIDRDMAHFLGHIYAYARCSLPIILNMGLFSEKESEYGATKFKYLGDHSVVVSGYAIDEQESKAPLAIDSDVGNHSVLNLYAENINRIYAHDDGVGPFSRIFIYDSRGKKGSMIRTRLMAELQDETQKKFVESAGFFLQSGINNDLEDAKLRIGIHKVHIVPIHYSMRLTFDDITKICTLFYAEYLMMGCSMGLIDSWDIYITPVNKFKKRIFRSDIQFSGDLRKSILTSPFPKYLWVVSGYQCNEKNKMEVLRLVFDATDINFVNSLRHIFVGGGWSVVGLRTIIANLKKQENIITFNNWRTSNPKPIEEMTNV